MNDILRISLLQTDIAWENKMANIRHLREQMKRLCGMTDILVLPETFSTGFSMNACLLAEPNQGNTINSLKQYANEYEIAIMGSFIALHENPASTLAYANRAFFLSPSGEEYYYDKRHLFRMGNENEYFRAGKSRPIIHYKGWNILLLICYDLRFPVWSRNINNEYDLLIYVANWPASRRKVWDSLLCARALENESYVCGINRIGTDCNGTFYNGGTCAFSYCGDVLASIPNEQEGIVSVSLSLSALRTFRNKFPVWMDADSFEIKNILYRNR